MASSIKRERRESSTYLRPAMPPIPTKHTKVKVPTDSSRNSISSDANEDHDMLDNEQLMTPASHSSDAENDESAAVDAPTNNHNNHNSQSRNHASINNINNINITNAMEEMHILGSHSRQLIQTIQKLEALHIDATLPSLPKFVVVGDQSAGKSSIVEALCNVSIPRSAGTCTRCPFQITTTATGDGEQWECNISLQIKYSYDSSARDTTFERWIDDPQPQIVQFAVIKDKALLGDVLIRAQHALLNPRENPMLFSTPGQVLRVPQIMFSPNIICLDIKGPSLPELSFYDLPGSISVVENKDDQHLVPFIEKLVKTYLTDDKALIMMACSANNDTENSLTFRFLRECHAEDRCLGVLTKPDLIQPARFTQIARMLDGRTYPLGNGWHVTKRPAQHELEHGITQPQAKEAEERFFNTGFWSEQADYAPKFGIANLQNAISTQLRDHILDNLNEIISRVQTRLDEVNLRLSQFRVKDAYPMHTVMTALHKTINTLGSHIRGETNEVLAFRPGYELIKTGLRRTLQSLAPVFDPSSPDVAPFRARPNTITIDSDDDEQRQSATPTPISSKAPKRRAAHQSVESTTSTPAKRVKIEPITPSKIVFKRAKFSIADVERIRRMQASSSLPTQGSAKVTDTIIGSSMTGWADVLEETLEKLDNQMGELLTSVVEHELSQFLRCPLHEQTRQAALQYMTTALGRQKEEARKSLARELYKPVTSCNMTPAIKAHTEALIKQRSFKRAHEQQDLSEAHGGKVLSAEDRTKKFTEEHLKTLPADPYAFVIESLRLPFAYYDLAVTRFADNIALGVEADLFRLMQTELREALDESLGARDNAVCEQLLTEDAGLELERRNLLAEKERLQAAMHELHDLPKLAAQ